MKIDRIVVDVISVPIDPPRVSSLGTFTADQFGIVQVFCDGVVGLGEVATLWNGGAAAESRFLIDVLAPRLLGRDPRELTKNILAIRTFRNEHLPAQAALDMALHDLKAKLAGMPVFDLLGGRCRDEIVLSRSIPTGEIGAMTERARAAVEQGFTCVKVKIGRDVDTDLQRVAAVREAIGPAALLRVDANMAWPSVPAAVREINRLEQYNIHSVEQPIMPGRPEDLRMLRQRVSVPIMADESVWSPEEAYAHIRSDAVDMINVYVAEAGGIRAASDVFRLGQFAGVSCTIGAMPELGIGTAASIHLGLSVAQLDIPADASGSMYHANDIIAESFSFDGGTVNALEGDGLGVTLDTAAMKRFLMGESVSI